MSPVGMFFMSWFLGLDDEEWWHLPKYQGRVRVKGTQSKAECGPGLRGKPLRRSGAGFGKSLICQPVIPYSLNCDYLLSLLRLSIILVKANAYALCLGEELENEFSAHTVDKMRGGEIHCHKEHSNDTRNMNKYMWFFNQRLGLDSCQCIETRMEQRAFNWHPNQ